MFTMIHCLLEVQSSFSAFLLSFLFETWYLYIELAVFTQYIFLSTSLQTLRKIISFSLYRFGMILWLKLFLDFKSRKGPFDLTFTNRKSCKDWQSQNLSQSIFHFKTKLNIWGQRINVIVWIYSVFPSGYVKILVFFRLYP